jgi:hypothetical protein
MVHAKIQSTHDFFMDLFLIGAWLIRKMRNDMIFRRLQPSLDRWKNGFFDEVILQANRFPSAQKDAFLSAVNCFR